MIRSLVSGIWVRMGSRGIFLLSVLGFVEILVISFTNTGIQSSGWQPTLMGDISLDTSFQALVLISVGEVAHMMLTDISVQTIRQVGDWDGPIFLVTDRPNCFKKLSKQYDLDLIVVDTVTDIMEIKSLKCRLLQLLPSSINSALYIDTDILVTRPIRDFELHTAGIVARSPDAWIGLFEDAKAHSMRMCPGCDKWHTGVMYLSRGKSEYCLERWREQILSGVHSSDQEAMDYITNSIEMCNDVITLQRAHIRFMKDYVAVFWRLWIPTFSHFTSARKISSQGWFYKRIVEQTLSEIEVDVEFDTQKHERQCNAESAHNFVIKK